MIISRLKLTNWRNFSEIDVPLRNRAFIIGPNASAFRPQCAGAAVCARYAVFPPIPAVEWGSRST